MIKIVKTDQGYSLEEDGTELTFSENYAEMRRIVTVKREAAYDQANLARRIRDEAESRAAQFTAALMRGPE